MTTTDTENSCHETATSRVAVQQLDLSQNPEQAKTALIATSKEADTDNPDLQPTLKVLQALAQCHEQTYRLFAEALGIPLDGVQVRLQAAMDLRGLYAAADRIRAGFSNLHATVEIS